LYSALEECRADLVGLYMIGDPKMVELGAYEAAMRPLVVETAYIAYVQSWMSRMDRVEGLEVREAHDRGHHAILMWLVRGGEHGRDYGVEVKKIDALRLKSFTGVVEAGPDQSGERFVIDSIVGGDLCKRRLIISTRMLIAVPRIDPKTLGARLVFHRRLAEGEITFAAINPQLDEQTGFERGDEVIGEVQMAGPGSHAVNAWFEVARRQFCVDNFHSHASRRR
jgi:hypothetical protein